LKYRGVKVISVAALSRTVPVYDVQVMLPEEENTHDNHCFYIITSGQDDAYVESKGVLVHNCGEIILRPYGLCNLSEVVIRPDDEEESLLRKVTNATILGTLQSTLTDFRYVRDIWRKNAEEERLLGVSLTGIFDNSLMYDISTPEKEQALRDRLDRFREHAIAINAQYADMLGINRSAAITTIKPSGTVSQLVNCSSGIHPGYSEFYIRRVRADMKDPLAQYMINAGVPYEEDKMKPGIGVVFSFPQKAAPNALLRDQIGAMGQIKLYQIYKDHWCEHNPSITVYYKDHEFLEIGNWIYNNFEDVGGISFLPHTDHIYEQAPYEEITEEQYNALVAAMPELNWARLQDFEKEDSTTGQQTFACTGNVCEIVDLNA
jgi:ribonucleoside-diphosphate reductase alpha chain